MPIYVDTLPYLKTLPKSVALPKGSPQKHGNIVFLYSNNYNESLEIINNPTVFHDNKYTFYFYDALYKGVLNYRSYNIVDTKERTSLYKVISTKSDLLPHPIRDFDSNNYRNTYFEMSKYISIFNSMTQKMPIVKHIESYWRFIRNIVDAERIKGFDNKMMIINAATYKNINAPVKELISNPLFMIYYTLYKFPEYIKSLDIDIFIYCNKYVLKINPSLLEHGDYNTYKRELNKIFSHIPNVDVTKSWVESDINLQIQKDSIANKIKEKYNFIGQDNTEEITSNEELMGASEDSSIHSHINNKITSKIDQIVSRTEDLIEDREVMASDEVADMIEVNASNELDDDKEMLKEVYNYVNASKPKKSALSTERDRMLREKQKEIKLANITLGELQKIKAEEIKVPTRNVSKVIKSSNPNMQEVKFSNFEKAYNEILMPKDIANVFTSLNNKSIPMYVRDIQVTDSSDELNYKDTYKVLLEDANRQRHTVTVDIPKFIDDKFLYLGGNKKVIIKQNFFYPVIKSGPDEVQIVTNYNKMFITRLSTRSLGSLERLFKLTEKNDAVKEYFKFGDASVTNLDYVSFIEYDELSKVYLNFNCGDTKIFFNQKEAREWAEKEHYVIPEDHIIIGAVGTSPIYMNIDSQLSMDGKHIHEYIVEALPEELQKEYRSIRAGKRLMYNRVKLMDQYVPLVTILCYWEGIMGVLKKANVKYRFSEKVTNGAIELNEAFIKFADGYFIYEDTVSNGLLLNGLNLLECSKIKFTELDTAEPFVDFFTKIYGKANIINALTNFYEFIIDSITLEILESIDLPTDIVSLLIYANNLLSDNAYTRENVQSLSRIRSNEIIPAILNKVVADNYIHVRNSGGKKKLSVPRDAVIKQLIGLQTVEDYSTLNPKLYGAL